MQVVLRNLVFDQHSFYECVLKVCYKTKDFKVIVFMSSVFIDVVFLIRQGFFWSYLGMLSLLQKCHLVASHCAFTSLGCCSTAVKAQQYMQYHI